jgi:hypothetical protein
MKRLIGPFGTLFAFILLGVVAACVLGLTFYDWCKKLVQAGWLRFKPTPPRQTHPQTSDQTRLSIQFPVTRPATKSLLRA